MSDKTIVDELQLALCSAHSSGDEKTAGHIQNALRMAAAMERCPHQSIVDLYHSSLPQLQRVRVMTDNRRSVLRARWREHPGLDWWRRYFGYVAKSDFLMGRVNPGNGRDKPFQASLDWIIKPSNMANIIEGKYHDKKKSA